MVVPLHQFTISICDLNEWMNERKNHSMKCEWNMKHFNSPIERINLKWGKQWKNPSRINRVGKQTMKKSHWRRNWWKKTNSFIRMNRPIYCRLIYKSVFCPIKMNFHLAFYFQSINSLPIIHDWMQNGWLFWIQK